MAKQITIKEIALKTGVSRATVDRVLHQRGKVSAENLAKIEKVLESHGYKYNIHTSAVSLRKAYKVAVVTPEAPKGEYWSYVIDGIREAVEEYSDVDLEFEAFPYDQFSKTDLKRVYDAVLKSSPDAIIIGPGFEDLTIEFCNGCDAASIPYAFVDSQIECTRPIASYTADQPEGGYIAGRILGNITPEDSRIAVFSALNEGEAKAYNASRRLQGILEYFSDSRRSERLLPVCYVNMHEGAKSLDEIGDFIAKHPDIGGVAVMNSRGHLVADAIAEAHKSHDIKIVAFDCTDGNRRCLLDGSISVILSQRPRQQGFQAVRSIIEYLLYRKLDHTQAFNLMPIDILLKENLKYYNN